MSPSVTSSSVVEAKLPLNETPDSDSYLRVRTHDDNNNSDKSNLTHFGHHNASLDFFGNLNRRFANLSGWSLSKNSELGQPLFRYVFII